MQQHILQGLDLSQADFKTVLAYIETHYNYTPTAFKNGARHNAPEQNQGSAKVFAFAQLHQLNQDQTLALFAEHYAHVLATPETNDHQNIRQFMQHGWAGIEFLGQVLSQKD